MTVQNLIIQTDDRGVATISLNRPERHNAFDDQLIAELTRHWSRLPAMTKYVLWCWPRRVRVFSAGGRSELDATHGSIQL